MLPSPAISGASSRQKLAALREEEGVVLPGAHCCDGASKPWHLLGCHHRCLHIEELGSRVT